MLKNIDFNRLAAVTVCTAGAVLLSYLAFKYLLGALLPFAFAYLLGQIVQSLAAKIAKKVKTDETALRIILTVLFIIIGIFLCTFTVKRIYIEMRALFSGITDNPDMLTSVFSSFAKNTEKLSNKLPFLTENGETFIEIEEYLSDFIKSSVSALGQKMPTFVGRLFISLPKALLALAVFVISAFYFAIDMEKINLILGTLFPKKMRDFAVMAKKSVRESLIKYIKAYLLIMLIIFFMLFVGFLILGVNYSFLFAALLALIDFLPVLGVGSVLIPWALICFITKSTARGVGLLVLYAVILISRQFIEPKIVGKNFGIHPLLTLFSMYLGIRIFGIFGVFIGPLAVAFVKSIIEGQRNISLP